MGLRKSGCRFLGSLMAVTMAASAVMPVLAEEPPVSEDKPVQAEETKKEDSAASGKDDQAGTSQKPAETQPQEKTDPEENKDKDKDKGDSAKDSQTTIEIIQITEELKKEPEETGDDEPEEPEEEKQLRPVIEVEDFDYDEYEPIETSYTADSAAQKIYSVLSAAGIPDNNIAGVLANWYAESRIDPTCVEGIYSESYQLGSRKQSALKNLDGYTRGSLWGMYSGISLNTAGYMYEGKAFCGLGLGQYTGPAAAKLLATAESMDTDWYNLEFQIAYALSDAYRPGVLAGWNEEASSPGEAAFWFLKNWEGVSVSAGSSIAASRPGYAVNFKNRMKEWKTDEKYAAEVLEIAKEIGSSSIDMSRISRYLSSSDRKKEKKSSEKSIVIDGLKKPRKTENYTFPHALSSLSFTDEEQAEKDDQSRLKLIRSVIEESQGNAGEKAGSVAVAARWSGMDIDYPAGAYGTQVRYLKGSVKWQDMGKLNEMNRLDLKKGDVIAGNNRIIVYAGNDVLTRLYEMCLPSSLVKADLIEQTGRNGQNDRLLVLKQTANELIREDEKAGIYTVYRCVRPDSSNLYREAHFGRKSGMQPKADTSQRLLY